MNASASVGSMHSLLQKQIDATEKILRAQKELLEIQCQMQATWSDEAVHKFEKKDTVSMPSEEPSEPPDSPRVQGDTLSEKRTIPSELVSKQTPTKRDEDGTYCKVFAQTLLDPVANLFPSNSWNRFDHVFEALPAHRLKDLMDELMGIIGLFNMLIFTAMFPWFAGWSGQPETVAELLLYELVFLAAVFNFFAVPTSVVLQFTLKMVNNSNLHAWLFANRFLFKFEALLRFVFDWSCILAMLLKQTIDICGDEMPQFLSSKIIHSSTRVAVVVFNLVAIVGTVISILATYNVSHYTAIYSGALCHAPVVSPQELVQDGGVSKLLSATLAGLKLGTSRLRKDYQRNRHEEEEYKAAVKDFEQLRRRSKNPFGHRHQRAESDNAFWTEKCSL